MIAKPSRDPGIRPTKKTQKMAVPVMMTFGVKSTRMANHLDTALKARVDRVLSSRRELNFERYADRCPLAIMFGRPATDACKCENIGDRAMESMRLT